MTPGGAQFAKIIVTGADVWAYAQGGQIYHTKSIHDGTYHFYNIPPGTYMVYAEATVGSDLRNQRLFAGRRDGRLVLYSQPV